MTQGQKVFVAIAVLAIVAAGQSHFQSITPASQNLRSSVENDPSEVAKRANAHQALLAQKQHINRTTGSYGTHEQWVYGGSYLYFQNGVLTTIQN